MGKVGGAREDRTPDLSSAIAALSHLSYCPTPTEGGRYTGEPDAMQSWFCAFCAAFLSTSRTPWMPREDSNLDKQSQSLLSYR
jgi:hypothetical protein